MSWYHLCLPLPCGKRPLCVYKTPLRCNVRTRPGLLAKTKRSAGCSKMYSPGIALPFSPNRGSLCRDVPEYWFFSQHLKIFVQETILHYHTKSKRDCQAKR